MLYIRFNQNTPYKAVCPYFGPFQERLLLYGLHHYIVSMSYMSLSHDTHMRHYQY